MKDARIDIRVTPELLARVDAEAERLGQSRTKFIERSLEMALSVTSGQEPLRKSRQAPSLRDTWSR